MAYVSPELKAKLAPKIKEICKKYKVKCSIGVNHHSTLVVKIPSGPIDFIGNYNKVVGGRPGGFRLGGPATDYMDVNYHWFYEHFDGDAKSFLDELIQAMKGDDYFDDTDTMIDHFHCSHYLSIKIGAWNKPYVLTA
jgi:hypothetical protein